MKFLGIVVVCLSLFVNAQTVTMTQKDACSRFSSQIVRIDVDGGSGTGFIVSPDGWILTADHVVFDAASRAPYHSIIVRFDDGSTGFGTVKAQGLDWAIVNVPGKHDLPFLSLGSKSDVTAGSDIAIIGYPFSARDGFKDRIETKFCISGFVTATDLVTYQGEKVDVIYFQGPAVKGISGAPIISRDTGSVVGIQSQLLAGISQELLEERNKLAPAPGMDSGGMIVNGSNQTDDLRRIIDILYKHLANGLGTAIGIDDCKSALSKAQKAAKVQH